MLIDPHFPFETLIDLAAMASAGTSKASIDPEKPYKGAKGFRSQGGTVYSKCVLYVDQPTAADGGRRFHFVSLHDMTVKPKYFTQELTNSMRKDDLRLGLYDPDVDVRIFAKVERGKVMQ